jgi:DNA mismatch endonuclease, patch repair protein
MSRIRGKNTKPEIIVRSVTHRMGYRYRLHWKDLPGKPDLVFPSRRKVIFVHGCYWHQHPGCPYATMPATRRDFWQKKLFANRERDKRQLCDLKKLGWGTLVLWECELADIQELSRRIHKFLE